MFGLGEFALVILSASLLAGASRLIYRILRKDPLAQFDLPLGQLVTLDDPAMQRESDAAIEVLNQRFKSSPVSSGKLSVKQRIPLMRDAMETFFSASEKLCVSSFIPVDAGGVPAEWVVAPGVDAGNNRRLLYIHGGAFFAGSPKTHRVITSKLSEISNCSVLAIDYRLMPEYTRLNAVEDCRIAYDWMMLNGAQGAGEASSVLMAGDSAGGNLTLVLLAWLRDTGRRPPNAALALSPVTDCRFASPSIYDNLTSDIMLKPLAARITRLPRFVIGLSARHLARHNPSDPVISPLLGDLSNLAPTLVLASDAEILRDDGRRYANKAVAAGSDVQFKYWKGMPHVWPMFHRELPEAMQALEHIEAFFNGHS
jgi:acetyl esterase/lipase